MSRTERTTLYVGADSIWAKWFPKTVASEVLAANTQLEGQLVRFEALAGRLIGDNIGVREGPFSRLSVTATGAAQTILPTEAWDRMPKMVVELFESIEWPKGEQLNLVAMREVTVQAKDFSRQENGRVVPVIQWENLGEPPSVEIKLSLGNSELRKGWKFVIGFASRAFESRARFYERLRGYVHEILPLGEDPNPPMPHVVFLNGPQYTTVRWKVFDQLHDWLSGVLPQQPR